MLLQYSSEFGPKIYIYFFIELLSLNSYQADIYILQVGESVFLVLQWFSVVYIHSQTVRPCACPPAGTFIIFFRNLFLFSGEAQNAPQ